MVRVPTAKGERVRLGPGYEFLNLFCAFCGHRFEPLSGWRACAVLVHQVFTNLVTAGFLVLGSFNLYVSFSNFSAFLFFGIGYLTTIESVFRTAFIIARRGRIVDLALQAQNLLSHSFVVEKRASLLKKLSSRLVFLLIYFMILYGIALYCNSIVMNTEFMKLSSGNHSVGLSKVWLYINSQLDVVPDENVLDFLVVFIYLYTFLMVGRLMATDFIFYSWYWLFLEQYEVLTNTLPRALGQHRGDAKVSLKTWLKYQRDLSKFLCDVNKFLSPIIGSAVILSGFKICLLAIVSVKLAMEVNIMYMVMFGVISTQRVYIFCMVGQRIKEKISNLHAAAFHCSWLRARRKFQNAALMICNASCERAGLTLPGSPFFALSLEFFATIMSAVFTYFIVIIQIQK